MQSHIRAPISFVILSVCTCQHAPAGWISVKFNIDFHENLHRILNLAKIGQNYWALCVKT